MVGPLQYIFPEREALAFFLFIPYGVAQVQPGGQEIDQCCGFSMAMILIKKSNGAKSGRIVPSSCWACISGKGGQ